MCSFTLNLGQGCWGGAGASSVCIATSLDLDHSLSTLGSETENAFNQVWTVVHYLPSFYPTTHQVLANVLVRLGRLLVLKALCQTYRHTHISNTRLSARPEREEHILGPTSDCTFPPCSGDLNRYILEIQELRKGNKTNFPYPKSSSNTPIISGEPHYPNVMVVGRRADIFRKDAYRFSLLARDLS